MNSESQAKTPISHQGARVRIGWTLKTAGIVAE